MVDTEVENSLLKRALGYNIFLKKPMKIKKDQYEDEIVYVDEEVIYWRCRTGYFG